MCKIISDQSQLTLGAVSLLLTALRRVAHFDWLQPFPVQVSIACTHSATVTVFINKAEEAREAADPSLL
jgi:hypothetical protein